MQLDDEIFENFEGENSGVSDAMFNWAPELKKLHVEDISMIRIRK